MEAERLRDTRLVDERALGGVKAAGIKVKMVRVDISPVLNRG